MNALALVVLTLASYRLVRLAIQDTIFDAPRARLYVRLASRGPLSRWFLALISCYWCLGVWVSAALVAAYGTMAEWPVEDMVVAALAVSAAQPFVHLAEGLLGDD